jgi:Tfp pilus assembly protein PilZ
MRAADKAQQTRDECFRMNSIDYQERMNTMNDQRVFTRIPLIRSLIWRDMAGNEGASQVENVGRGGLGMVANSYLRPGPIVTLVFDDLEFEQEIIELQAIVAWCKPVGDQSESFQVGLSWVHGEQRTLPQVNEVFYSAIVMLA